MSHTIATLLERVLYPLSSSNKSNKSKSKGEVSLSIRQERGSYIGRGDMEELSDSVGVGLDSSSLTLLHHSPDKQRHSNSGVPLSPLSSSSYDERERERDITKQQLERRKKKQEVKRKRREKKEERRDN